MVQTAFGGLLAVPALATSHGGRADPPPEAPVPPILPPRDGFLFLDRDKFHGSFAGDLPAADAGSNVVEVPGSHSVYLSQPAAVVDLIKKACSALVSQ